jgi:hypothetical protein
MKQWWARSFKERHPLPEEEMILLRKVQVRILFEACNLLLDGCELTLKSADVSALARPQLLLLTFH